MSQEKVRIGVIGCGNISDIYLKNAKRFPILETVAVADVDKARAKAKARRYDVPVVSGPRAILKRDDIDVILNLTPPAAHARINLAALEAGKHVYTEKPLATKLRDGAKTLAAGEAAGLQVACAPDTVLGGGIQTCRKLIDDGAIGQPVAATAFMMGHGPERWHPDPEFFYKPGGGPMMDMGPYYLTALTLLIGPIRRVEAMAKALISPRVIGSGPKQGQRIEVETPDHIAGVFEFAGGAIGTIITSFACWGSQVPRIEIYGTDGTLSVPDPNRFGGPVKLLRAGAKEWTEMPLTHGYAPDNFRCLGLAEMATAIRANRPCRCTGTQAYHVLEVMHAHLTSARQGRCRTIESDFERPAPMPPNLQVGQIDP